MPRGNFWEATYDPDWDGPTESATLEQLDGTTGFHQRCVVNPEGQEQDTIHWVASSPQRSFQDCDISVDVIDSLVSNCTFEQCRFRSSKWTNVKFSNCAFDHCDFSRATFSRCVFVNNCAFKSNTASGELFRIEETAISARAFMRGLKPNVQHLPPGTSAAYQAHRFVSTRQKIAKSLYSATVNESDVEYYFEAYEVLTRCTLAHRVERHRFQGQTETTRLKFFLLSAPAQIERALVLLSGALTNWGRGILRAAAFAVGVILLFTAVYAVTMENPGAGVSTRLYDAFLGSLNITLVAGYTAYFDTSQGSLLSTLQTVNVMLGLLWYSLIVPVLARRILR